MDSYAYCCDVLRKLEFIYDEYRQILKFPSISIIIFAKKLTSAKKHLHVIIKMVKKLTWRQSFRSVRFL